MKEQESVSLSSAASSVRSIKKRNGAIEIFQPEILESSIRSAFERAGFRTEQERPRIQGILQEVIHRLAQVNIDGRVPQTDQLQELVGATLIEGDLFEVANAYLEFHMSDPATSPSVLPSSIAKSTDRMLRPRRHRLPDERQSITHKFEIGSHTGYITVGLYEDGKPGEIFISMSKDGSTLAGLLDAFATSVSIGLQYGVPLQTLIDKFSHVRFEPSGFTQNPNIRMAKSVVDYIFRWLGTKFPNADTEIVDAEAEILDLAAPASSTTTESRSPVLNSCPILTPRRVYKPFEYPQYFDYFMKQNQAHWMPTEVPMENDISDYKFKLTPSESNLIINILRFFTQGDIEVNNNYNTRLIPLFPKPEIKMMLSAFAHMEGIHVWAYSYLNDSLGLPEKEYSAFLDYESMRRKYEYIQSFDVRSVEDLAVNLAVFGGFMEGVSLFSSFAILMHFPRMGKLKGVGQIVTWSIRDETLHSRGVCQLFRDLISENKHLWTTDLQQTLYSACKDMVSLEDAFIDTCFSMGDIPGLKAEQVKQYIRYIADRRLNDLGLEGLYNVSNSLPWLDVMVNAKEHTNFFENRATEYAKGAVIEDWSS